MTGAKWLRLLRMNLRRGLRQFLLSSFGIAVGIAALAFFGALSAGVRQVVMGKVFHADRIEVEPAKASFDVGMGGIGGLGMLGGGGPRPITDEVVSELRAIDGVKNVAPRMKLGFPAKGWGGAQFFGGNRYVEILGDGIDPQAVAGEAVGPEPFADLEKSDAQTCTRDDECTVPGEYCAWDLNRCEKPVPALVSRFLVELYNSTFAGSHGLPRISDFLISRFMGFTFRVELVTSFVGTRAARGTPRQRRVMLVGVSDRAVPIGISFPLGYVRRWNAEYAGASAGAGYSSVTIEVVDKGAITRVAAKARGLGLSIADSGAEQAGLAITLVTLLFALVSLAIIAVATINIAHTFFRTVAERRREIGVLRAIGACAWDVQAMLLGEAAAVGLCGGVAGIITARLAALAIDLASRKFVPDYPFKPDTYFDFSLGLIAAVLVFAVIACVLGAALPARAAARLEPADALTQA